MSNQHTPEPWPEPSSTTNKCSPWRIYAIASFDKLEDAKRARELWNATLDMANPAEEVRAMREKAAKFDEYLDYHCDHCKEPVFLGQRGKCVVGDEEKTWRFCSNECAHLSVEAENESRGIEP